MQTTHTPGPWEIDSSLMVYAAPQDDFGAAIPVADCAFEDAPESLGAEARDNARLIAAAPDLLAALEAMVKDWQPDVTGNSKYFRHWEDARAAIAKAKGGDPS